MITEKTVVMMLDTETTNDIECPICYDVGYQIFTLGDGVLCEKSFVNADIFLDKEMMENAYFADKIPQYWDEITGGKRQLRKWYNIRKELREDCQKYEVEIICAHNARFDYLSLHTTQRYITTSKYRWVLPYGIEWYDTLKMSREVFGNCDEYKNFCDAHEYRTKNGQHGHTIVLVPVVHDMDCLVQLCTGLFEVGFRHSEHDSHVALVSWRSTEELVNFTDKEFGFSFLAQVDCT